MQLYISNIKDQFGHICSVLGVCGNLCWLSFNGSDKFEGFDSDMLRDLWHSGCAGIMNYGKFCNNDHYVVHRVSKSGIALMSCLEYKDVLRKTPPEMFYVDSVSTLPIHWRVPTFNYALGENYIFGDETLRKHQTSNLDTHSVQNLILQYYRSAGTLGGMFKYNTDMLSYMAGNVFFDECMDGTFYFDNFTKYSGSGSEFDETGYIDCNINHKEIYRLYKSGVFQYMGCPLYVDETDNLYLGYISCEGTTTYSGVLWYKIKDRKKFDVTIAKAMLVNDIKYEDMYEWVDKTGLQV